MSVRQLAVCVVVLIAVFALGAAPAFTGGRGNPNPEVIPLNAKVGGLTYSDWGDRFWAWQLSIRASDCPVLNQPGGSGPVGQSPGPVFLLSNAPFLPGQTNIGECWLTVGRGQQLFLPLTTFWSGMFDDCLNADGMCALGYTSEDVEAYLRDCGHYCMSFVTDLYATVDGRELHDLFSYPAESSQPFACPYSEDSQWAGVTGPGGTIGNDAGLVPASVTDGYYLLLAPLSEGDHVISYGATNTAWDATAGVIYHITVR